MQRYLDVNTGEIQTGGEQIILTSNALGSCVAVVLYDSLKRIGGLAHVMLPDKAPINYKFQKLRYAVNAIDLILDQLIASGAEINNLEACLIGGGNVLKRENDTIGLDIVHSIESILMAKNIRIMAQTTGGTERRSVTLDIGKALVSYTLGDGGKTQLWNFGNRIV